MTEATSQSLPTNKEPLWSRSFTLICSSSMTTIFAFYSIMPVMPLFLKNVIGMDEGLAGVAIGLYTVAAVFSRLVSGYLLDAYGRRVIYFLALLAFSAMFFLYIAPMGVSGIIVLRIVHGLVWGVVSAAAQTAAVDSVPASRRGEGIGIFGLSVAIGMAISPAIGLWIVEEFTYTTLFFWEGAVLLLGLFLASRASYRPAPAVKPRLKLNNLLERSSIPISLMALMTYMGFGAAINWIAVYAETSGGRAGLFFTCMAVGTGFTRMVTGKVFDQRGPIGVSIAGFIAFAASMFLLAFLPCEFTLYAGGLLVGIGSGVFMPVNLAIINSLVPPDRRGATNSTYYTFFECGIGAGVLIAGALMPITGLQGAFALFGCTVLLGAAYFYLYALPKAVKYRQSLKESY